MCNGRVLYGFFRSAASTIARYIDTAGNITDKCGITVKFL